MLPLEPPGPGPPTRARSAKLRELRALTKPASVTSKARDLVSDPLGPQLVVMLPFEPKRLPSLRANSAAERFHRATNKASAARKVETETPVLSVPVSGEKRATNMLPIPFLTVILPFEPKCRPPVTANSTAERFRRATRHLPTASMSPIELPIMTIPARNVYKVTDVLPDPQLAIVLPFEPKRRPPATANSASERFRRAIRKRPIVSAAPVEESELPVFVIPALNEKKVVSVLPNPLLTVILPFEPKRRPPARADSASERCRRATKQPPKGSLEPKAKEESYKASGSEAQTALPEATCLSISTAIPLDISSPHILFQLGKYYDALQVYQEVLDQPSCPDNDEPHNEVNTSDFIDYSVHAAKCCYQLRLYAQADYYCQMALDRIALDALPWGPQRIHCTILKAKALGRMRKTKESLQLLRDCRELIHQFTSYKTVKEYLNESDSFRSNELVKIVAQE